MSSQTAQMPPFPFPALPLESAYYLAKLFLMEKQKVFATLLLTEKTVLEVHLQQQDFSQLCTVQVNM